MVLVSVVHVHGVCGGGGVCMCVSELCVWY